MLEALWLCSHLPLCIPNLLTRTWPTFQRPVPDVLILQPTVFPDTQTIKRLAWSDMCSYLHVHSVRRFYTCDIPTHVTLTGELQSTLQVEACFSPLLFTFYLSIRNAETHRGAKSQYQPVDDSVRLLQMMANIQRVHLKTAASCFSNTFQHGDKMQLNLNPGVLVKMLKCSPELSSDLVSKLCL